MNTLRRKSVNSNRRSSGKRTVSDLETPEKDKDSRRPSSVARPPSDIPSTKWCEILDDAEQDFIVNSIREELICRAMDMLYARYLEKNSYAFVVHCSYLAWMRLFNVNIRPAKTYLLFRV
ncbi:uncharacterized protein LOC124416258 [Diprion similis]|uniref:uncharacterized protein LOC124416258 n=1 Tax=Diprion similis TaxID=362088 RepID=UPI001EF82E7C|nr:uncharacterized protein LOC124416258 [Diprion similis]